MALANYTQLRESVIKWSHRGDLDLLIDDFILMAEEDFYSNLDEPLRLRPMETQVDLTLSANSRTLALPTDYLEFRRLRIRFNDGSSGTLTHRTPANLRIRTDTGYPCFFTITEQIEFDAAASEDLTIELQYYKKLLPLNSTNTTNAILTNNPKIYLFGCLHQAFVYATDEVEAQKYLTLFNNAVKGANERDSLGRQSPAPAMSVQGRTP
jgi:hypothetical protein